MDFQVILFFVITLAMFLFLYKKLSEIKNQKTDETLTRWLNSMQATLNSSSDNTIKTLQQNSKELNDRLDRAAQLMKDVGKEVGEMSEIGRSMKELQDFLKSPKLRGNIGEQVLKDLISQMFPKNCFFLQHQFKTGEKVDAAIKTDAGLLPIDSKFPMENFQKMSKAKESSEKQMYEKEFAKDVKKHIIAIAQKYILPDEGTMDFALMYVPSESVYYEIVNKTEIMDYAKTKRIYIVSPSTLYAHLQMILLSFEGRKIESQSKHLFVLLRSLQGEYQKLEDHVSVLGKHITNSYNQFGNLQSGFFKFGDKLNSSRRIEKQEEILAIDEKSN